VDPIRQEARGIAEYTDRNFFGGLRRFDLSARAGYAFILFGRANSPFSQGPFYTLTADFQQPHFLHRELQLHALLESSSNVQQAYRYLGGRAQIGLVWQPNRYFSIRPSYNFEAYRLWGSNPLLSSSSVGAPQLTFGCTGDPCNVFLSYLEEIIEWDRRDNPLEPRRGYYLALSLQEGGGPLGGSFTYIRVSPDLRYFQPLGDRFVVAARVRAGTLLPLKGDQSPIVARFFSGGANSMRGFGINRLSPLEAVPQPISTRNPSTLAAPLGSLPGYTYGELPGITVPIGGHGLFEASVELRWELIKNLNIAVFWDMGLVTPEAFGGWGPTLPGFAPSSVPYFANMLYAAGVGVRYLTPVGPIRVDFGYRLNIGPPLPVAQSGGPPSLFYPIQGTCFGIGDRGQHIAGSPEGPCVFHIAVGEAF
jgi:translocation and assembly module TamA